MICCRSASASGASVLTNGVPYTVLAAGQFSEFISTGAVHVTADNPILVAQYATGGQFDGTSNSDPAMMLVVSYEQWVDDYSVATIASGFTNYINVVVTNSATASISTNGVLIPPGEFTAIGTSGFSYARLTNVVGSYRLTGPVPFGVNVYGFGAYVGYGHPGGMNLGPVVAVSSLTLGNSATLTVNTVTATLNGNLAGVRVDFKISGLNNLVGFAFTDGTGVATFIYTNTGTPPGADTIEASVGNITDTPLIYNWP